MSDGTYIMVESSKLSEGDLIVVITRTSTLTGSDSSNEEGGRGEMGGFGGSGGGFPGGDFDFGNFDPSQMPGGGFSSFGG